MKPLMKIDNDNNEFTAVIPCDCHYCGGLIVDGIDIDYVGPHREDKFKAAFVHISMWRRMGWDKTPTFWERVKLSFKMLFGKQSLFIDDMVFFKEKMTALRDICDTALQHWPSDEELSKPGPTLEEIYAHINKSTKEIVKMSAGEQ